MIVNWIYSHGFLFSFKISNSSVCVYVNISMLHSKYVLVCFSTTYVINERASFSEIRVNYDKVGTEQDKQVCHFVS